MLADPSLRLPQTLRLKGEPVFATPHLAANESGGFEDADVAGDSGERHRQRRREIGDPGVAVA